MESTYKKNRKPMRLRGYDYSQAGMYFVTVCTHDREGILGVVENGEMRLSEIGQIVQNIWAALPRQYCSVTLDAFVVMPNHLHGIIQLTRLKNNHAMSPTIGDIVRGFKARGTYAVHQNHPTTKPHLWQRNYYEHIVRTEGDLTRIRKYIIHNPVNWEAEGAPRRGAIHCAPQ